jgi:hypothetical protein
MFERIIFLRLCRAASVLPLAALCGAAAAQGLADPTRPPSQYLATQRNGVPADGADGQSPDVQIVVTGRSRGFAVVKGRAMRPGETLNGTKLVSVGPEGAVWERDGVRESPSMNPAAMKTHSQPPVARNKRVTKAERIETGGTP